MAVVTIDSYSESNFVGYYVLQSGIPCCGQSFTGDGRVLDSVKLYLAKSGSPALDCYVRIHSHTGTYGTSSKPDALLSTSEAINASTLGTDPALVEFTFSGENKITLADGTYYVLVLYYNTASTTHIVGCGADDSSPTHNGNAGYEFIPSYRPASGVDLCFYVYGDKITPGADAPVVSTTTTTLLNRTVATVGGNVTDQGTETVTERGIYYGTDEFSQTNKLTSASGAGAYSIFLSGLTPNTKYYYKAFATSSIGTSYGDILNFTTGNSLAVNDKTALPPFNRA